MLSIRFKITVISVAAILTAVLIVYFMSFPTVQAENDRQSVESMNLVCLDTQNSLEKYTDGIEQSVEFIANIATDELDSVELVKGGVAGSPARRASRTSDQASQLDAYLASYFDDIRAIFGDIAIHTQGVIAYYYCIVPEISEVEHGFFYSRVGRAGFSEQEPIDARELDPNDTEHDIWYFQAIKRGRPSWIGPYTGGLSNDVQVSSYVVPIYKSGALVGLLGMDISIETLVSQVSSIKVYDTGFACLLDAEGHILYHPEKEVGSTLDIQVSQSIFHQDDSGDELIRYTANGEERQMSFTTLTNGMKLAVVAPTGEINARMVNLLRTVIPITVIVVIVFAVLLMLAMRLITNPLVKLTAASQRLAADDYDVELDYGGHDEVGALTASFQRMRNQLKENIEDLNRKAHYDDLTGLPNQRYFFELAKSEKARMLEEGKRPAILFFNLVGMKHFNRQYSFTEGDNLIREVAAALARQFGELRTSRFSQDYFAVITDEERLEERLNEVFLECQDLNNGKTLPVHAGIYQNSLEEVKVSIACDRAKYACDQQRGSYLSGFRYFDAAMVEQLDTVRHVINHLDEAMRDHWIEVYYQPIVFAANGRVCDEEALSRWNDPKKGFLSPADFIPTLENAGLIYKLDLYVLDQVLQKMKLQAEAGLTVVPHSINLSRSDFDACDIVEEIRERVDAAGITRDLITIEITESIIGSDFDFMKEQIVRFQKLGFPVWMDDFGSGYSSLDVLKNIKFDLIKFDMSFLRDFDESENAKIILTKLMQMATALGVETLCEGVETESQCRFLKEIGCSKLQGYYYCKPIPLSEILELYEKGTLKV